MSEYPAWLIDTAFVLPLATVVVGLIVGRIRAATAKARAEAKLDARLDAQDKILKGLADGFTRQFGTNGFVLHERQRALEADLGVVRDGLAAHVAQHVDRSFGR